MIRKKILSSVTVFAFLSSCGSGNETTDSSSDLARLASPAITSGFSGTAMCTGEPTVWIRSQPYSSASTNGSCSYGQTVNVTSVVRGSDGMLYGYTSRGYIDTRYLERSSSTTSSGGNSYTWPVDSRYISSPYGPRTSPCAGCSSFHKGIDFPVSSGTIVYASNAGNVASSWGSCGGNTMNITGSGTHSRYLHLTSISAAGKYVTQRSIVARSGNTGTCTTGAHLHFEILSGGTQVNPSIYIR